MCLGFALQSRDRDCSQAKSTLSGGMPLLNMVLPKIEVEASSQNYGHFVVGPLESGYGITLGNALRRVLL